MTRLKAKPIWQIVIGEKKACTIDPRVADRYIGENDYSSYADLWEARKAFREVQGHEHDLIVITREVKPKKKAK